MSRARLIAIGAVSIDTILNVPYYPQEDSKLRATRCIRRRGGNSPNSLEVLLQLLRLDDRANVETLLIAPLPARGSRDNELVASSLKCPVGRTSRSTPAVSEMSVSLDHCLYRGDCSEAVSSYIIASDETKSRTIVNHNILSEMTFEEFACEAETIVSSADSSRDEWLWFHFEGRIPDTTLGCIKYLRRHPAIRLDRLRISVELEKPRREGLQALAYEADVVFYSRSWAEGEGYLSAGVCLREQAKIISKYSDDPEHRLSRNHLLICTWGASGASALTVNHQFANNQFRNDDLASAAYTSEERSIVDTTGAGDTFIAGLLFGLMCKGDFAEPSEVWTTQRMLDFANDLAGRKILQYGFQMDDISFDER